MEKVGVLIDFDNIFPKLISEYTNNEINHTITTVINKVKQDYLTVDMIDIRLYGGWYTGNTFTPRASSLGAMLPSLNSIFPILERQSRRINGSVSLATELYGSSFTWYNSHREKPGIPQLRVDTTQIGAVCNNAPDQCPVYILKRFTKKRTRVCRNSGCTTNHSSVFFQWTQKYVDTMLACDVISFSLDEDVTAVYVFSDDVDMFPSFSVSKEMLPTQTDLHLLTLNAQNETVNRRLLSPFNVFVSLITL